MVSQSAFKVVPFWADTQTRTMLPQLMVIPKIMLTLLGSQGVLSFLHSTLVQKKSTFLLSKNLIFRMRHTSRRATCSAQGSCSSYIFIDKLFHVHRVVGWRVVVVQNPSCLFFGLFPFHSSSDHWWFTVWPLGTFSSVTKSINLTMTWRLSMHELSLDLQVLRKYPSSIKSN